MEGGELAAPIGQITLSASGRVYLAQGSTVSTAGSIAVDYGSLNDVFWTIADKTNTVRHQWHYGVGRTAKIGQYYRQRSDYDARIDN